jgi:hypothetical protein
MKINKKIFAGIAVFALLFGLLLAGCGSFGQVMKDVFGPVSYVETQTSQEIFRVATELVASQRLTVNDLMAGLGSRFPGLTPVNIDMYTTTINFRYQGKEYYISVSPYDPSVYLTRTSIVSGIKAVKQRQDTAQN